MKCELVQVGMQSVQIEDVGDCRTQKWDTQLKASTEDDRIKLFPGLVAEPNFSALNLPDPGLNANPALSNRAAGNAGSMPVQRLKNHRPV